MSNRYYRSVPNYLPGAILVTVFCCQIGGLVSLYYAMRANSLDQAGKRNDASYSAELARRWMVGSVWFMFGMCVLAAAPLIIGLLR